MADKSLTKIIVTGAVAGVLGGGAMLYGQRGLEDMQQSQQKVTTKADKTVTIAKDATATSAYNKVSDAVVSVLNFSQTGKDSFQEASEGSGVIYKKSGDAAYVVTNNHVINGAAQIQVMLHDGQKVTATLVGKDAMTDLAVLKIAADKVTTTAAFGDSNKIQVGQKVLAIGSPLGSQYASSVTEGIISAKKRLVESSSEDGQNYGGSTVIQTDAAINPGNSGGALVNSAGQVIGINSMKLAQSSDGTSVEGMGFAIPSNEVVTIVNELVKKGKITRPQLGVRVIALQGIPEGYRSRLKINSTLKSGIYIASVNKNSSAANAGMKSGDVITKVDGKKIDDVASLHSILYSHKVGDTVNVTVNRNGKDVNLKVKLEGN